MTKKSLSMAILIPDGEHALLARHVKNCFSEIPGLSLHLMCNKKHKAIRFSHYITSFSYYPKTEDETDWISNINTEIKKHNIDLVMPVYDESIITLLKHKNGTGLYDKLVPLPQLKMFDIAYNKALLAKHLKRHQISAPKSFGVNLIDYSGIEESDFPILAKPVLGIGGGTGIQMFQSKQDFINGFKPKDSEGLFLFEEFIKGYDLGCNVLCNQGKIIAFTIQKGTLFSEKKYAPQIGLEFLYQKELYEIVEELMASLDWTGVANIDVRFDTKDGKFKVLEINPRFWATLDASLSAGVNFPYLYCLLAFKKEIGLSSYRYIHFLTLKGVLKRLKQDIWLVFRFNFLWNNTSLKYLIKDPIPFFFTIVNKVRTTVFNIENSKR